MRVKSRSRAWISGHDFLLYHKLLFIPVGKICGDQPADDRYAEKWYLFKIYGDTGTDTGVFCGDGSREDCVFCGHWFFSNVSVVLFVPDSICAYSQYKILLCGSIMVVLGLLFMALLNYFLGILTLKFEEISIFPMIKDNFPHL